MGTLFGICGCQLRQSVRYSDFQLYGRLSPRRFSGPPKSKPRFIIFLVARAQRDVYQSFPWTFASSITVGRWEWNDFLHVCIVLLDGTPGPILKPRELPYGLVLEIPRRRIYRKDLNQFSSTNFSPPPIFLFTPQKPMPHVACQGEVHTKSTNLGSCRVTFCATHRTTIVVVCMFPFFLKVLFLKVAKMSGFFLQNYNPLREIVFIVYFAQKVNLIPIEEDTP